MIAVFHTEQPTGRYVATCDSYPDWHSEAATLAQSRDLAEDSLRDHIARTTTFDHYTVPISNRELRAA